MGGRRGARTLPPIRCEKDEAGVRFACIATACRLGFGRHLMAFPVPPAGWYKPDSIDSASYGEDLAFVSDYGSINSTVRSAYDTASAGFW